MLMSASPRLSSSAMKFWIVMPLWTWTSFWVRGEMWMAQACRLPGRGWGAVRFLFYDAEDGVGVLAKCVFGLLLVLLVMGVDFETAERLLDRLMESHGASMWGVSFESKINKAPLPGMDGVAKGDLKTKP